MGGGWGADPPIWNFRHDKPKKWKVPGNWYLPWWITLVGPTHSRLAVRCIAFLEKFEMADFGLSNTHKNRVFFISNFTETKKHILYLNSMVIKTCLGVVWTYLRPLTNIWKTFCTLTSHSVSILAIFAYFGPFPAYFGHFRVFLEKYTLWAS